MSLFSFSYLLSHRRPTSRICTKKCLGRESCPAAKLKTWSECSPNPRCAGTCSISGYHAHEKDLLPCTASTWTGAYCKYGDNLQCKANIFTIANSQLLVDDQSTRRMKTSMRIVCAPECARNQASWPGLRQRLGDRSVEVSQASESLKGRNRDWAVIFSPVRPSSERLMHLCEFC